jgi:hydroxyacylglutathione hydrolase
MMKRLNKIGPPVLHGLPIPEHLPANRLNELLAEGVVIVDTRLAPAFASGHIPGAINIPYNNAFSTWAGWLLSYDRPFYLIADTPALPQIIRDLTYIGLDNAAGYFEPAVIEAWPKADNLLQTYQVISPLQIADKVATGAVNVVDVRNLHEWQSGHIPGAQHIMLGYLPERLAELPKNKPILVQCQAGARSAIGAGLLQAHGFPAIINLQGGITAWAAAGLPIEK